MARLCASILFAGFVHGFLVAGVLLTPDEAKTADIIAEARAALQKAEAAVEPLHFAKQKQAGVKAKGTKADQELPPKRLNKADHPKLIEAFSLQKEAEAESESEAEEAAVSERMRRMEAEAKVEAAFEAGGESAAQIRAGVEAEMENLLDVPFIDPTAEKRRIAQKERTAQKKEVALEHQAKVNAAKTLRAEGEAEREVKRAVAAAQADARSEEIAQTVFGRELAESKLRLSHRAMALVKENMKLGKDWQLDHLDWDGRPQKQKGTFAPGATVEQLQEYVEDIHWSDKLAETAEQANRDMQESLSRLLVVGGSKVKALPELIDDEALLSMTREVLKLVQDSASVRERMRGDITKLMPAGASMVQLFVPPSVVPGNLLQTKTDSPGCQQFDAISTGMAAAHEASTTQQGILNATSQALSAVSTAEETKIVLTNLMQVAYMEQAAFADIGSVLSPVGLSLARVGRCQEDEEEKEEAPKKRKGLKDVFHRMRKRHSEVSSHDLLASALSPAHV